MLPCIQGLLEIRIFKQISSSNSTTSLQKRIIFILKMDLMRLRESKQLVPGYPAHKLQSQNLTAGLCDSTLSCLHRGERGPVRLLG